MSEGGRVVVVTGLSGAGKSTALHALEDLGYFCVDNLPTSLVEHVVEVCEAGGIRRIGLGIDVRVGSFLDGAVQALDRIGAVQARLDARPPDSSPTPGRTPPPPPIAAPEAAPRRRDVLVIFLDASDESLMRRFSETRRPHPLSPLVPESPALGSGVRAPHDRSALAVLDGILLERTRLAPLRARATLHIDTTLYSVHELRRQIIGHLGPGKGEQPRMSTRFLSFGFKYGVPVDADLVFDVRFLDNPYFVKELRRLSGVDPAVREFVLRSPEAAELVAKVRDLLTFAMPRYEREGKSYLTVGFGCTGGRHRSVAIAEALAAELRTSTDLPVSVVHRDVAREAAKPAAGEGESS
jgi:UPF0042 nucleotide-binding protein